MSNKDDVEMTKDGATKFVHPDLVEAMGAMGWKAAKAPKPAKEGK